MSMVELHPTSGGRIDVYCTECDWKLPTGWHDDHGTPERPGGADLVDERMPAIGSHVDATGHAVRTVIWTYTGGLVERSSLLTRPGVSGPRETYPHPSRIELAEKGDVAA